MTKQERIELLKEKLQKMKEFDIEQAERSNIIFCGVDEVGRGPLAAPVVTACVVLPPDFSVLGIDDSKKVSEKKREELYGEIINNCTAYGIGMCDNNEIDKINILEATKKAMAQSIENCNKMLSERNLGPLGRILIDAVHLENVDIPQTSIIKGDAQSLAIAAASIVAKVTRDRMMIEYAKEYPWYGFESNKGYGTKAHYDGIAAHGITPIHRKSFLKNIDY